MAELAVGSTGKNSKGLKIPETEDAKDGDEVFLSPILLTVHMQNPKILPVW